MDVYYQVYCVEPIEWEFLYENESVFNGNGLWFTGYISFIIFFFLSYSLNKLSMSETTIYVAAAVDDAVAGTFFYLQIKKNDEIFWEGCC